MDGEGFAGKCLNDSVNGGKRAAFDKRTPLILLQSIVFETHKHAKFILLCVILLQPSRTTSIIPAVVS